MEFRQLRYFVKVAELRSFSEASKALFISQSTLSQQIKQLEEELGVELLVRDSRHVSMSDYGEQYLPYAKQVLKDVDTSTERMNDVRQLKIGTLNVGANALIFADLIPEGTKDGYEWAETHHQLEDNIPSQAQWKNLDCIIHKRRCAFAKNI